MKASALFLILLALLPPSGIADDVPSPSDAASITEKTVRSFIPTGLSSPASLFSGVELRASKGSSEVSTKMSRELSGIHSVGKDGQRVLRFSTYSITASAPLDDDEPASYFWTQDGFAHSAALEFGISRFMAPIGVGNEKEMAALCRKIAERIKDTRGDCNSNFVRTYGERSEAQQFESLLFSPEGRQKWIYGASVKLGHKNFHYLDAATATRSKRSDTPWGLGAFVSYRHDALNAVFSLSGKYQRAYQESDEGVLCSQSSSGTPVFQCLAGPVGAPVRETKRLLSLEARRDFGLVAAGIALTHEFGNSVTSFDFPVYFVKNKDSRFSGGVKSGWRGDTDEWNFGVFVTAAFGLWE